MKKLCNLCRKPNIIKNKYISNLLGTLFIYIGIAYILPIGNFSVYITSYISIKQDFVTMHYGTFFSLILTFTMTFSRSIGGMLESKIGFLWATELGLLILLIANIFFFRIQNIWLCYFLIIFLGLGAGIATSLLGKNLTFYNPKKKGSISGIIGIITVVLSAAYSFGGEKIINPKGATVNAKQVYEPEICQNTYRYYLIGFIAPPIGGILGFLFLFEYKKEDDPKAYLNESSIKPVKELHDINGSEEEKEEEEKKDEKEKDDENVPLEVEKTEEEKDKEKADKEFEKEVQNLKQKRHRKQVVKSWRFWRMSLAALLLNFPVMFMVNTGRIFGAIIGINGLVLQLMGIFQAFGMVIIGPILGYISDKKNPLTLMRIVTLICVVPGIILNFFLGNSFVFMLSLILYLFGLIGNMVGQTPLIMEVYGIQESVILGGLIATISKVSEIVSTVVAFSVSFIYKGNSIRIPYKIIYILSSAFSYYSFYLFMWEEIDKFEYDDSDFEITPTEINRESIVSNL